jgi:hypothetical protein
MSSQIKPGLVLRHGIHAEGSCFNKVMPCVPGRGHIRAIRPRRERGDVAVTRSYLGQVSGPAVLIGHCCGGANIVAAADDRVAGLVYIATPARAPVTSYSLKNKFPKTAPSATLRSPTDASDCGVPSRVLARWRI